VKKLALGLAGAAMFIVAPLAVPSAASADPGGGGEIWKCWHTRSNTVQIPRTDYWTCVGGVVHRVSTYDGRLIAKYDGDCANGVRQRKRSATWVDMIKYCPSDGRARP
jgi:hypothetical protein